jgi:predicted membrane-bound spermidine synthase
MMNSKLYKRSRLLYHAEAALEYLVALSVSGSFLAYLTASLGISDSVTGIISSIISLGCLFQLCSLLIRRQRVKNFVVWASMLNQICFMVLYILPLG